MAEFQVSMTALRQNLGNLVNRAAYGGERIVLVSHGEPKAAIVSITDLRRLEQMSAEDTAQHNQHTRALTTADQIRERIHRWQVGRGVEPSDSVRDLRKLREERDDELGSLR